jgi:putative transposase
VLFSTSYVQAVSGMLYLEVLVLQVQYMTDSRNGERLVFSSECGSMDCRYMIKKLGSIGNGRLWMALLQKRLLGEKSTGPNPTDRAKSGTKRSILVDGKGVPLGVSVDGANRHDMKMTKATLQSIVIYRPEPTIRSKQHMCMDKGYAFPEVYELLEEYGYTIHIRLKGKERSSIKEGIPKYRARRWVVERTHSWMNRFRRLLVRWEKRIENYIGMLHFACAWITYRRSGLFA